MGEQALDLAHDVHHMGVALDHHQLAHLDAARLADPTEIVAAQIHQHHVLGPFLGIRQQISFQLQVFGFRQAAGPGAGNGPQGGFHPAAAIASRLGFHHHLWAGSNQVPAAEVEERHVGRGVHHPQAPVELKGIPRNGGFEPLAQHQLEYIPRGDVVAGGDHGLLKIRPAPVALGLDVGGRFVLPWQGCDPRRQGLVHARFEVPDPGGRGGIGGVRVQGPSVVVATEIGIGHRGDLALDLVKHQQAVGQHPAAIGGGPFRTGMHGHAGFNPADQFVAPEAKQLAHRGQARHRGTGEGR